MVVLLVLLLLSNLWFGWAVSSTGSSTSSKQNPYDVLVEMLKSSQNIQENKEKTCAKLKSSLANLALSNNWKVESTQQGIMSIRLPNGETFVINKDCRVKRIVPVGRLKPPTARTETSALDTLTMKDFTFETDVGLFKVLFQLLMYAAAIFWAVRAAQRLIAGELTEMFITLFIGLIIVATMYVLYRGMLKIV
jgi:hypothetical protein